MTLFRAGNDEAFRVIHDRYRARLLGYARQMLAASPADPEDAVQEIFVRAYAHLRSNGRELALRAWLYRIAHNRCIDDLRRPAPPTTEAVESIGTGATDPHDRVEQRDALRRLIADVQRLPDQQRSALLMRELGGVTYADVADALGVSVPAVKSLLVRARLGLAQASEARDTACAQIREAVITAHDRGVRASGLVRRHMRDCAECRRFRSEMRSSSRRLAALVPALGPVAVIAKLLGVSSGTAGSTGAQGAAVSTSAAVSTGTAVTGTAVGTGAATSTGIIGGVAGTVVGAGHVATVIAAAVVTAGGAIGIQQMSTPTHHPAAHRAVAQDRGRGQALAPGAGASSGAAAHSLTSRDAFGTQSIAVSLRAVAISQHRLGANAGRLRSPASASHGAKHAARLPITTTQDPDHYLPPPADTTGSSPPSSGTTTTPIGTCTAGSSSSTCTPTGTDPCTVPDAGSITYTGSPPVSSTESPGATGDWSSCTTTTPPTGTSTAPTTGSGSTTGPSTGTGSTTGTSTGAGSSTGTGTGTSTGTGTGTSTGSSTTTGSGTSTSSGSSTGTGATPKTQPKVTDPFSHSGSGANAGSGQGLSSTSSATATPKAGAGATRSLKRGSSAAVYSSH